MASMRPFIGLALGVALGACTLPNLDPGFQGLSEGADPKDFRCCEDPDRQPKWFADLARSVAEPLDPVFNSGSSTGFLAPFEAAKTRIASQARAFDILTLSSKSHLTSRMLPGWFTHSAVYLGTEAQLKAAGLWSLPELDPFRADIRAGNVIIESVGSGVRLTSWSALFAERDAVALLRPDPTKVHDRDTLQRALSLVGKPFDFYYDLSTCDRLACSEVICRSFPAVDFPIRTVAGTQSLLPDDIAAKAIRGEDLRVVDYVRATDASWNAPGLTGAMEDVAGFWGDMEQAPKAPVQSSADFGTCEATPN